MTESSKEGPLLGEFQFSSKKFSGLEGVISELRQATSNTMNPHESNGLVSQALCDLLLGEKGPSFLLDAVIDFIQLVNEEGLVEGYTLSSFELWLNQFSGLSDEENYAIRAKITGKSVPREAYQIYFPIGMDKRYQGTHFVTAHNSPDLDTTVASFWGWMDAFGARVGDGMHLWNIPGGPPHSQIEISLLFKDLFGQSIFDSVAKTRLSLTLSSLDLMTQSGMQKKYMHEVALSFDHERQRSAVVVIDEKGYYLGDWRTIDVEGVRQIVMGLNNCLMWLESFIHIQLISCFAKEPVKVDDIAKVIREILNLPITACHPLKELPHNQVKFINDYLVKVLKVKRGVEASFEEFALAMESLDIANFSQIIHWLKSLVDSDLFGSDGAMTENRPLIFNQLEVLVKLLSEAFVGIRNYVDRLEIAFKIKTDVFGFSPQSITHRTGIDEIRSKMGAYSYLTVNHTDVEGRHIPIGVVHSSDVQKHVMGTVSLRDFCNRDEMKIPSYLQVISVIDHHKTTLHTDMPPTAVISDAQSSNAMVAQMAFTLNDQFSLGGMDLKGIDAQLKACKNRSETQSELRVYQRLLQKKQVSAVSAEYNIDPRREFVEYLHFVYAILDDTDLLTKVSRLDVVCMASLLNRLKSLMMKKEVEVVHFDDIQDAKDFTKKAAKRLLQNKDFYSLYSKVYLHKEQGVDDNLSACAKGQDSNVFSDTKTLNFCNRVGQTKIFARNYALFEKLSADVRKIWHKSCVEMHQNNGEVLLYLHMISTIASADELFMGGKIEYDHYDELWIWIPESELAIEKLKAFLSGFKGVAEANELNMSVLFTGENSRELSQIFRESFADIPHKLVENGSKGLPIAILRYKAGALNSRKAMIAPYLPRISS